MTYPFFILGFNNIIRILSQLTALSPTALWEKVYCWDTGLHLALKEGCRERGRQGNITSLNSKIQIFFRVSNISENWMHISTIIGSIFKAVFVI